jgi:hypothetical protein
MLFVQPGASITASVENLPTGLVGVLGVRLIAVANGEEVIERQVDEISELPAGSGIYVTQLVAPTTAGDYLLVWDTGGKAPDFESKHLHVGATPTAVSDGWRPTVADVATAIRSRTYTNDSEGEEPDPLDDVVGGAQAGTFNDNTRPTDDEVESHITAACTDVLSHFASGEVPEDSHAAAARVATLKAALAIELAAFDGTAATDSPYLQLRIEADRALQSLINTAQTRDLFAEERPEPEEEE